MKKVSFTGQRPVDDSDPESYRSTEPAPRLRRRHGPAYSPEEPLEQAPSYLVDIKKIDHPLYKGRCARRRRDWRGTKLAELAILPLARKISDDCRGDREDSLPELRNASTLGGDLLQEVWCQYLRGGYSCWRTADIYAMGPSAITATIIRLWADGCVTRFIRATAATALILLMPVRNWRRLRE